MTAPLTTMTDRDLLLNLYVSVVMAVDRLGVDPGACTQQILQETEPQVTDHIATLADIVAEVERRLEISALEIDDIEPDAPQEWQH